jgi:hypothetical protein
MWFLLRQLAQSRPEEQTAEQIPEDGQIPPASNTQESYIRAKSATRNLIPKPEKKAITSAKSALTVSNQNCKF